MTQQHALTSRVIRLYLNMLWTARDIYPNKTMQEKRDQIKRAFLRNAGLTDEKDILKAVERGEYVLKEMEALVSLSKYRTLKRRYDTNNEPNF
jgi:hypothetical protein